MSDDKPYSEALLRTLKYTPAYPANPFADLDEARQWVARFVTWYHTGHRHSGIRFVTPAQRHAGEDAAILALRTAVYEKAKQTQPDRWRGRATRHWEPVGSVWLNPDRGGNTLAEPMPLAA